MSYEIIKKNGVKVLQFINLRNTGFLSHGFSTRIGGVSPSPYNTLNLGFTTSDDESNLTENRRRLMSSLGLNGTLLHQQIDLVHGVRVITNRELRGDGVPVIADGILTDKIGLPLVTTFADCVPLFFVDRIKKVAGVAHAGWRGTFAGIAVKVIEKMAEVYNSNPPDILAGIGPGIGSCCFEVGDGVASLFFKKYNRWKDLAVNISNTGKWKINLFRLNKRLLMDCGLEENNISVANLCTACREDLFFSYRRDGKLSGRMTAVIAKIS
ncbi:MAG: peptidoglycan editing factor PgeF [Candidatus Eremiobacteraeota bacterium]|nr:peptidoglycan editing factor PgeF [Candidatus Eremiobacteraeota bacterium]